MAEVVAPDGVVVPAILESIAAAGKSDHEVVMLRPTGPSVLGTLSIRRDKRLGVEEKVCPHGD
jgi:hypothetical protein